MIVVYLILFVASFLQILVLNKANNLSLKSVVFKICNKTLFKIIYGSYFAFFSSNRSI